MVDAFGNFAAFIQVAETRSFTDAARNLGLSASALGKSVSRLEARVGARLFYRRTRSVTLTAEGLMFLERCRRIVDEYETARVELSQTAASPRGRLRVSLPLVSVINSGLLEEFAAAYPEIELDLDFTDRIVDVINEGFDAVIRTGEADDSRLRVRKLTNFHHRVVASPGYLDKYGAPATPADLSRHLCLLYRFPSTGAVEHWPLRDADAIGRLSAKVTSNSIGALVGMCCNDLGLACLPEFAIRFHVADGRLRTALDNYLGPARDFRILWPGGRGTSPKVRAFIDFVLTRIC